MLRKTLLGLIVLALLLTSGALAQDDDKPTIAILGLGEFVNVDVTENAILEALLARGFINAEERATLAQRQDLQGENLNIIWGTADFDLSLVPIMIDNAIDQDADVLLTTTTVVTVTAVDTTLDMDDPPVVLFTGVSTPFYSGIADAPCIKPDHVTGIQARVPYEEIVPMLLLYNPGLQTIGTIFHSSSLPGAFGVESIQENAAALGMTVETAAIVALPDLRAATQGLIDKGVEVFLLPADNLVTLGTPIIAGVAMEYDIPIYHVTTGGVTLGATLGIGGFRHYQEGIDAGIVLAAYLNDEIDIANTGIGSVEGLAVGMNVDLARAQDIELDDELLAAADLAVTGGMLQLSPRLLEDYFGGMDSATVMGILEAAAAAFPDVELVNGKLQLPAQMLDSLVQAGVSFLAASGAQSPDDSAFLASLHCSDAMIAEQRAALDAAAE